MSVRLPWDSNRDEELGKKDDNYRPRTRYHSTTAWTPSQAVRSRNLPRWRPKRLLLLILVVIGLWIVFRPGSSSQGLAFSRAFDLGGGGNARRFRGSPVGPKGPPPRADSKPKLKDESRKPGSQVDTTEDHYYSGPIKFYNLKASLLEIAHTSGRRDINRNVMFAASSLSSVANLLPLACEMSTTGKTYVHFALLGRAALRVDAILDINGVDRAKCKVFFHDARPDYSEYSTEVRAEASVVGALHHIYYWIHPQAVIIDDEEVEDHFFVRAIRGKMKGFDRPVIEIPLGQYNDFRWMTRLSSISLGNWHRPRIEILIHSPPNAGGGLARLLKSLLATDFGGFRVPKLTLELPSNKDDVLTRFLGGFNWPPYSSRSADEADVFKLKRRIPSSKMNAEESSVRFVESYLPSHTQDDHLLILSTKTEVSPRFFHYLMFTLLQSRYSAYGPEEREHLAGITLSSPKYLLDGETEFTPPSSSDKKTRSSGKGHKSDHGMETSPPFLWQAPSSDAILLFGDRWLEFHDFLTRRLQTLHAHPDAARPTKEVSTNHPTWLEFFVELVKARGWLFLYPPNSLAGTWATTHKELQQTPEEFRQKAASTSESPKDGANDAADLANDEPFLMAKESASSSPLVERPVVAATQPLHDLLPNYEDPMDLSALPIVSLDGSVLKNIEAGITQARRQTTRFRMNLGGCTPDQAQKSTRRLPGRAGDLFCLSAKEIEEFELLDLDMDMLRRPARIDDMDEDSTGKLGKAAKTKGRDKVDAKKEQLRKIDEESDLEDEVEAKGRNVNQDKGQSTGESGKAGQQKETSETEEEDKPTSQKKGKQAQDEEHINPKGKMALAAEGIMAKEKEQAADDKDHAAPARKLSHNAKEVG